MTNAASVQLQPLYLEKAAAAAYLAISVSTLEAIGRTDPSFPRPRAISKGRVGWLVAELQAWGLARPVSTALPPPNCGRRDAHARPRDPEHV